MATRRTEPQRASGGYRPTGPRVEVRNPRAPRPEPNSLLFPAAVGREFASHSMNSSAISDGFLPAWPGRRRVSGDLPTKLPEAGDFPLSETSLAGLRPPPRSLGKPGGFPGLRKPLSARAKCSKRRASFPVLAAVAGRRPFNPTSRNVYTVFGVCQALV